MSTKNYIIEQANPADAAWIARFQVEMALETENLELDPANVIQGVNCIFNEPTRGFYIIARDRNGTAIGSLLILKEWSDWRNADIWWIHSVYVVPDHRRKGIFKKMFAYIEELAHTSGARGLRLYVDKNNVKARDIYLKLDMNNEHYELFEKMF